MPKKLLPKNPIFDKWAKGIALCSAEVYFYLEYTTLYIYIVKTIYIYIYI